MNKDIIVTRFARLTKENDKPVLVLVSSPPKKITDITEQYKLLLSEETYDAFTADIELGYNTDRYMYGIDENDNTITKQPGSKVYKYVKILERPE